MSALARTDIDTTAPNLMFRFNQKLYTEREVREVLEIMKPFAEIRAANEYAFSIDVAVTATILIAIPVYYFSKGFFSRLGEKLGEEVGSDAVAAYRRFKDAVATSLTQKAEGKRATLRFELLSENEPLEVHAKVESSSERDFQRAFDMLEELAVKAKKDADDVRHSLGRGVVRAHYRYEPESATWTLTWAMTDNGRFIALED